MKKKENKESGRAATLTAKESKDFQAVLARVGARKAKGFIYLCQLPDGAKAGKDGFTNAKGLVFSHDVPRETIVMNLMSTMYPSQLERIVALMTIAKEFQERG